MVLRHCSCLQRRDPSFGRTCITHQSVSDRDDNNRYLARNDTVCHYHVVFPLRFSSCSTIETSVSAYFPCRFFHAAIRQAVVPFLLQRVSLFQLRSAIEFSMGSFVLNKHHLRWSVLTFLCVGLLGSLTSAYVMFNRTCHHVLLSTAIYVAGPLSLHRSLSI